MEKNNTFTRETLDQLHKLTAELKETKEIASELLRTAQDRFKTRTHKITRNGKEIELTEKVLWDEVFYLGVACEAAQILKPIHPEVFEAFAKQDEKAKEIKKFSVTELGLDYEALTLSDYLRMTEGLFKLLLSEKENGNNK